MRMLCWARKHFPPSKNRRDFLPQSAFSVDFVSRHTKQLKIQNIAPVRTLISPIVQQAAENGIPCTLGVPLSRLLHLQIHIESRPPCQLQISSAKQGIWIDLPQQNPSLSRVYLTWNSQAVACPAYFVRHQIFLSSWSITNQLVQFQVQTLEHGSCICILISVDNS